MRNTFPSGGAARTVSWDLMRKHPGRSLFREGSALLYTSIVPYNLGYLKPILLGYVYQSHWW